MAEQYPRSAWYDQKTVDPGPVPVPQPPQPPGKKHTGWKIAGITLAALIVVAASWYAASQLIHVRFSWSTQGTEQFALPENGLPDAEGDGNGDGDFAGDFREYFSSFYTPPSTPMPDSQLSQTPGAAEFRLTLHDAAGRDSLRLQELYYACANSVVGIRAARGQRAQYWGSGFIVSADGYIITNQHIISGAQTASVVLYDGRELPALLVGEDARTDIAVLKIEAEDLPAAELGDSTALTVGDEVAAIGNPLGSTLSNTLTNGIVSAIDRSISYNGNTLTLLQTNAAINEGNSGGPLFNMYGQVVGITNMKMSAAFSEVSIEGIGFAIPSATVRNVANQLIATGHYSQPGLGVTLGAIPADAADHYALPEGLYVYEIAEGSSAMEQGLQVGDVVTRVNGTPVCETGDVLAIRDALAVGDSMTLTVFRAGETLEITIELRDLSLLY